jgi:SAM-dependent methyltransferase
MIKLNLGSGRIQKTGFTNIDLVQIIDGNKKQLVDVVMDLDKAPLPYEDNSVDEICAENVLEHINDLKHTMNECWRVLKVGGHFHGDVPLCNSPAHWKDPTHKRCFIKETFSYFTGKSDWNNGAPSHPRYADYGFLAWDLAKPLSLDGDIIWFDMTPQK